jgi:hypothetical protein
MTESNMKWARSQYWRHKIDPVAWAMEVLPDFLKGKKLTRFYPWQKAVLRAPRGAQQIFLVHRQGGKSLIAALKTLHIAIFHERGQGPILITSPGQRQSGILFDTITAAREELEHPPVLTEDNKLSCRFENGARIISLHGDERTIRGYSNVELLIEDEAARVKDELFDSTSPMLLRSGGGRILMSTPWGKAGHFFREWENVEATGALRPTDFDIWQEYLCEFVETEDSLFSYEDIVAAQSDEVQPLFRGDEL